MSVTEELEKLVSLRDGGDLTEAEFQKAKELLLAGGEAGATVVPQLPSASPAKEEKSRTTQLLIGIFAALAALMSALSAMINPSPLKIASVVIWTIVAVVGWVSYVRLAAGSGRG